MREKYKVNVGDRSGRLTVLEVVKRKQGIYLRCKCDCGSEKIVYKANFIGGKSKSCGCLAKEVTSRIKKTHGMAGTKEYRAWRAMLNRCYWKKGARYKSYGGRGISVCSRWRDSFDAFLKDMGMAPTKRHSLGRIDNDKSYFPENCRWETSCQQANNTTRSVMVKTPKGVMTVKQAADLYGVDYAAMSYRAKNGLSLTDWGGDALNVKRISVNGKSKKTTEWMRDAGIPISSFYHHLRKGLSKEEIVRMYLER